MKNLKSIISYILGAVLVLGGMAIAGSLTPTGSDISPIMITLEDIYQKIQDFTYDESSHDLTISDTPSTTMHTLQDIWDLLDTTWSSADYSGQKDWDEATSLCNNSTEDGQISGTWRLPTYLELAKLYLSSGGTPNSFQTHNYWSGTDSLSYSGFAYTVDMSSGEVGSYDKTFQLYSVRCVR